MLRGLLFVFALAALACSPESQAHGVPEYGYEVVRVYPHDPEAFTQGLFYLDGFLYEGTGLPGESSIRKVKIETGEVLQKRDLPAPHFGEGIVNWNDRLLELTWEEHIGFIYDLSTLQPKGQFQFPGQGWGLTQDGKRIIMSDGTPELRFWDPESLRELGRVTVTNEGQPVQNLNELEWVKGEVFANVWQSNRIVRIDPGSGRLVGWINLAGLWEGSDNAVKTLNGIAYDAATDRLFVTGKKWPKLFEIRLIRKSP